MNIHYSYALKPAAAEPTTTTKPAATRPDATQSAAVKPHNQPPPNPKPSTGTAKLRSHQPGRHPSISLSTRSCQAGSHQRFVMVDLT